MNAVAEVLACMGACVGPHHVEGAAVVDVVELQDGPQLLCRHDLALPLPPENIASAFALDRGDVWTEGCCHRGVGV